MLNIEESEKTCLVCGRSLLVPGVGNLGALTIHAVEPAYASLMAPYEINTVYVVCLPCLLRALGVKPPVRETR